MSKGRSARAKGNGFERKIANQLKPILGDAKRGIQFRNGSDQLQDVECPLFAIECKSYKRSAPIRKGYEQAVKFCRPGKMPLAITKENHRTVLATASYEDFRALVAVLMDIYKAYSPDSDWEKVISEMIAQKKIKHQADDKAERAKDPVVES